MFNVIEPSFLWATAWISASNVVIHDLVTPSIIIHTFEMTIPTQTIISESVINAV